MQNIVVPKMEILINHGCKFKNPKNNKVMFDNVTSLYFTPSVMKQIQEFRQNRQQLQNPTEKPSSKSRGNKNRSPSPYKSRSKEIETSESGIQTKQPSLSKAFTTLDSEEHMFCNKIQFQYEMPRYRAVPSDARVLDFQQPLEKRYNIPCSPPKIPQISGNQAFLNQFTLENIRLAELEAENGSLRAENRALQDKIQLQQRTIEKSQEQSQDKISQDQARKLLKLLRKQERKIAEMTDLNNQLQENAERCASVQSQNEVQSRLIQQMKNQAAVDQQTINQYQTQNAALQRQIARLSAQIGPKQGKFAAENTILKNARGSAPESDEVQKLQGEIRNLKASLQLVEESKQQLMDRLVQSQFLDQNGEPGHLQMFDQFEVPMANSVNTSNFV